jgi:hypothetical protein
VTAEGELAALLPATVELRKPLEGTHSRIRRELRTGRAQNAQDRWRFLLTISDCFRGKGLQMKKAEIPTVALIVIGVVAAILTVWPNKNQLIIGMRPPAVKEKPLRVDVQKFYPFKFTSDRCSISGKGEQLIFSPNGDGGRTILALDPVSLSGIPLQINEQGPINAFSIDASGKKIALILGPPYAGPHTLATIGASGTGATSVHFSADLIYSPTFVNDGSAIVYLRPLYTLRPFGRQQAGAEAGVVRSIYAWDFISKKEGRLFEDEFLGAHVYTGGQGAEYITVFSETKWKMGSSEEKVVAAAGNSSTFDRGVWEAAVVLDGKVRSLTKAEMPGLRSNAVSAMYLAGVSDVGLQLWVGDDDFIRPRKILIQDGEGARELLLPASDDLWTWPCMSGDGRLVAAISYAVRVRGVEAVRWRQVKPQDQKVVIWTDNAAQPQVFRLVEGASPSKLKLVRADIGAQ